MSAPTFSARDSYRTENPYRPMRHLLDSFVGLFAVGAFLVSLAAPAEGQRTVRRDALRERSSRLADIQPVAPFSVFSLNFDLGVVGSAGGDEREVFRTTGGWTMASSLRVDRHAALDAALSLAIGAARVGRTIDTNIGTRGTSDYEGFLLLGGRYIVPSADESVLLSLGGGLAYAFYEEDAGDISKESIACYSCIAPTHGNGSYVTAEIEVLNADRNLGISLVGRAITVRMSDWFLPSVANGSNRRPVDQWAWVGLKLNLHF